MKSKIIAIVVVLLLALGVVLYLQRGKKETSPSPQNQAKDVQAPAPNEAGLGAQVYEKSQNPVKDEVPETNPFKEEYKNPFE